MLLSAPSSELLPGVALAGIASGGALGLGANVLTHDKEVDLKPEQLLQFRTAAALDVTIQLQDGKQLFGDTMGGGYGADLQPRSQPSALRPASAVRSRLWPPHSNELSSNQI